MEPFQNRIFDRLFGKLTLGFRTFKYVLVVEQINYLDFLLAVFFKLRDKYLNVHSDLPIYLLDFFFFLLVTIIIIKYVI